MKFKIALAGLILLIISINLNAQLPDTTSLQKVNATLKDIKSEVENVNTKLRKTDATLKLDDIKLSSAPAFSLLDISPTSIQKPASTKALTTSIISNLSNGIPQNYALEVTPFWFWKHRKLTSADYFGFDAEDTTIIKNIPFSRAQYFSVSLAAINKDTSTNVGTLGNHNVSFGLRGTLLKFYRQKDLRLIYNNNITWLEALKNEQLSTGPIGKQPDSIDAFEKRTQKAVDNLRESLKALPLFSMDLAFASNMAFETNSISSNRINRTGVWLNATLSLPLSKDLSYDNYLNVYAIGRYINDKDSLDQQKNYINANLFDYGAKLELQFDRLFLAYEYIKRTSSLEVFSSYRSVGIIQFKVSRSIFLTGSFGKNFSKEKNLITAFGINWGIANDRAKLD